MDHGGGNCSKNNNHLSWDFWEVGSSRFDWNSFSAPSSSSSSLPTTATTTTTRRTTATATATSTCSSDLTSLHFTNFSNHRPSPSEMHPFLLHNPTLFKPQQNHHHNHHNQQDQEPTGTHFSSSSSSSSSSSFILPHSHFFSNNSSDSLTCLKLGKRQYFEDSSEPTTDQHVSGFSLGKKNRHASPMAFAAAASVAVPRCQVEGCNVGLLNAKEYHKRHKVCEMHSKAPNVVVLGIEQRFCQQCSRFHVVSEFDDSKRSCRRRLAGHNERRRKNSSDSINRNHSQENKMGDRYQMPYIAPSASRALSLLSSKAASWVSPSDLSSRSSDALRELIAENRAAILAKQLFSDRGLQALDETSMAYSHMQQQQQQLPGYHFHEPMSHACSSISVRPTLDLMQTANSSYPMVLTRGKSKEEDDECEIWKSLEGTHIV